MIEQIRRLLKTAGGKVVAGILSLVLVAAAFYSVRQFAKGDTPPEAFGKMYVCSETGKPFLHNNQIGESFPIVSPFSGRNTGYPAEACYWTKEGQVKKDPTWVILNSKLGKDEPTFCPDCGRLIVPHNPAADPGHRPPPTREQWFAMHRPQ